MTQEPTPFKDIPAESRFRQGDVLVLFGELFGRGYASGLVRAARTAGMQVIGTTVGRRDDAGRLRPLLPDELSTAEAVLGGPVVNIPILAGFDRDAPEGGPTPTDLVEEMSVESWQTHALDFDYIAECQRIADERFDAALKAVFARLEVMIPDGRNVVFAHAMAGGIPRAKVFMAIANRIYKGRGSRYLSSQSLLESDLGRLVLKNFDAVTADSFGAIVQHGTALRQRIEASGARASYTAYGYHGTRILIGGQYRWQTYTHYTQAFAKMRLEHLAQEAWANGIAATVFNCPEIRTDSSDVFQGIELSLLPLLDGLQHTGNTTVSETLWRSCGALLKDGVSLSDVVSMVNDYHADPVIAGYRDFANWPLPNAPEQVEKTVGTAQQIIAMHQSRNRLVGDELSQHVVNAVGQLMLRSASRPSMPVGWIDHDLVAQEIVSAREKTVG
ncbi:enoyl ACP reductase FabMG family protein [Celeribacter baekdonensis]|uniref:Uncharacterized protein n=1 Tax=Celeribacter baekdonensis B30 TaxID=1208323 RepID=K2JCI5_9RHOB|nr:hypothetical protein [Celeribacter baekdonensis]EKE68319.1 hypothetical protein B30_18272 [Celeribacter baekdonensis B30]